MKEVFLLSEMVHIEEMANKTLNDSLLNQKAILRKMEFGLESNIDGFKSIKRYQRSALVDVIHRLKSTSERLDDVLKEVTK